MNDDFILRSRLANHKLVRSELKTAEDVLKWMGPIQGQDYYGAKWSISLRSNNLTDDAIEKEIESARIVRAWPLRSTLHFVAASDLRWIVRLTKPFILKQHAPLYRLHELENKTLMKAVNIVANLVKEGEHFTREEIAATLKKSRINTDNNRLSFILYRAGVEEILCFGPKRKKQFTYTSIDKWIPKNESIISGEEALRELARRYFTSKGPATMRDFMWWTGFSKKAAEEGIEMVEDEFSKEIFEGVTYYSKSGLPNAAKLSAKPILLPGFDEYMLSYTDRGIYIPGKQLGLISQPNGLFRSTIIMKGKAVGLWKRTLEKQSVRIEVEPFSKFPKAVPDLINREARRYSRYLGTTLILA